MMFAMFGFVANDAFVKLASADLPIGEIIFLRGLVILPFVAGAAVYLRHRLDPALIAVPAVRWRTVGEMMATIFYLTALTHMEIANATAILQSAPLMTVAGAALFLGEPVGPRRWTAIGIGLLGVLLIIRPGYEGFNVFSLVAFTAVFFIVLRDLSARRLPGHVSTLAVTTLTTLAMVALGAAMMLFQGYRTPSLQNLAEIMASSAFLLLGYIAIIEAMRSGEVGAVAPFRYSIMLWAIAFGYAVWGDVPDLMTLAGMTILIVTGLVVFVLERRGVRRAGLRGAPSPR